ncbi:MAG TPA: hypothetical protein VGE39_19725 [Prosthecobacter sp.]
MKHLKLFLACLALLPPGPLSAAPLQQSGGPRSELTPVAKLPAHLKATPDKVSLIADFDHKASGTVSIYLINASQEDIGLASQDGDLGCKREAKAIDGKWMRCDSHGYSWCGNSYGARSLRAGHFLTWTQPCDTQAGQARPLRFKLYGQGSPEIVSNEGVGVVDEADVQFCRYDAMAMRQGPFEDIAAVATGRVQGGQGASINERYEAIHALGRFSTDKRLFPVVKEVITLLLADKTGEPHRGGHVYTQCLASLWHEGHSNLHRQELWGYVSGQLRDPAFPWRAEALEWLVRAFEWEKPRLQPVIEEVLATASHPALAVALYSYPKVVEKSVAGLRLAALANDSSRPAEDRQLARRAWETLFPNPYLLIQAQSGGSSENKGSLPPLKMVTFTNISPQAITFPFARPEALLLVEVSKLLKSGEQAQGPKRLSISDEPGSFTIPAGQSVVIKNVTWWNPLRGQAIDPACSYNVHFLARTPGLWEVPARTNWSWSPSGDEVLKTLGLAEPPKK